MTRLIELSSDVLRAMAPPQPDGASDKNERGAVLVLAGGPKAPGAALLTGKAVLRVGAGKVQLGVTSHFAPALGYALPEAAILELPATDEGDMDANAVELLREWLDRADAVVIGPGMMREAQAGELTARLMAAAAETPFVVDAAAMTGLAQRPDCARLCGGRAVLTPHPGEMCRLLALEMEEVERDPLAAAREAAARFGAVVALKSELTFIARPDGRAWLNKGGAPGLATAGSGDVLAGVIGGLLARGSSPVEAACFGVSLHAKAGRMLSASVGGLGFMASEIGEHIPRALEEH